MRTALVSKPAGKYFFKVSNCAQKSSHLWFNFLSIGCFAPPPPAPVSEAPEYRRRLRKRAPYFGALAIEPVEVRKGHLRVIARSPWGLRAYLTLIGCAADRQTV